MKKQIQIFFIVLLSAILFYQMLPADAPEASAVYSDKSCAMSLTFDDGPSPVYTPPLLEGLKARGVHATFFLLGEQVEEQPALVRKIAADGHQIGNHTFSHVFLNRLSGEEAAEEIRCCDLALESILGKGEYWVRPPYGAIDPERIKELKVPVICWSVDPRDWEVRDTEKILSHIMKNAKDGSIILLHDSYPSSVEAALEAVDRLQAQGVEFLTVRQLLARKGIEASAGTVYRYVQ